MQFVGQTNNMVGDAHDIRCILDYGFQCLYEMMKLVTNSETDLFTRLGFQLLGLCVFCFHVIVSNSEAHIGCNICKNMLKTIFGKKDIVVVQKDMEEVGI